PAAVAGLRAGDIIVTTDGQPATTVSKLRDYIGSKDGTPIIFHVRRAESEIDITVTPQMVTLEDGEKRPLTGMVLNESDGMVFMPNGKYTLIYPTPFEQIHTGVMSIV